jgi:hypothetical protein
MTGEQTLRHYLRLDIYANKYMNVWRLFWEQAKGKQVELSVINTICVKRK